MAIVFGEIFISLNEVNAWGSVYPIGECRDSEPECKQVITDHCQNVTSSISSRISRFLPSIPGITPPKSPMATQESCESVYTCVQDDSVSPPQWCIDQASLGEIIASTTTNSIFSVLEKVANIILGIIFAICWLLLHLAGVFVNLASAILEKTLDADLYRTMFNSNSSSVINEGWRIIRDICNMFFILILLVIALATILRIQIYKAQSLLLPLLIAAFLINFSMPIVLLIIDAGQILMYYFVNMPSVSTSDIGGLISVKDTIIGNFHDWKIVTDFFLGSSSMALEWTIGIIFALIFLIILVFVFIAMALFMIIRLVALTILIIFSPLGFFFQVLPQTKSIASRYWSELLKYVMFGPIFAFFLYLSGMLANSLTGVKLENVDNITTTVTSGDLTIAAPGAGAGINSFSDFIANILSYLIVIIFLYASIWIARQMGIAGADKVTGMTTGKLAVLGGAVGGAVGGYLGAGARKVGLGTAVRIDKATGGRLGRTKEKWKKMPGGSVIMKTEANIKAKQRKEIEKEKEMLRSQSNDVLKAYAKKKTTLSEGTAAAVELLAERDSLKDVPEDKKLFEKAKIGGVYKDKVYTRMPTWAGDKQDKQKEVKRIAEEGKVGQISAESLKDKEIMDAIRNELSEDELKNLFRRWGRKQQNAALGGLKKSFGDSYDDIAMEIRKLHANLSQYAEEGTNLEAAFSDNQGNISTQARAEMKKYNEGMRPKDIGNVRSEDLHYIAEDIKMANINGARADDIKVNKRKKLKIEILNPQNNADQDVKNEVQKGEYWAV